MLIHFLKFIHLLLTLGLIGSALTCLALIGSKQFSSVHFDSQNTITRLNKMMLLLALLVMLTGTFLVHPKHFTFHTPWIQAAYVLVLIFSLAIASLILFKKNLKQKWLWRVTYLCLIIVLIGIIHDAVTKTTFLF